MAEQEREKRHAAGEGRGSITRNLFRNDVCCGDHPFSLIDTPGTDSTTETYKHAVLLRDALTATKIDTIFIVIKYDGRFDKMIENYFEVEQPVYNYADKTVVIISHWDQSKTPGNSFEDICQLSEEECPKVTNPIFCSERSPKSQVPNLMYNCISNMKEERLTIQDEDFFLQFNICEMKNQMKRSFQQYKKKASALEQDYTQLIQSVQSAPGEDKDEILHMTIVKFKDEMETLLQEFREEHGVAMVELDYYAFCIKMEKENVRICDDFVERVVPLMSYNLFDNQDPRNLIKRCPYCKLIWFKTEGCDGQTTCGNNHFSNDELATHKAFWKYYLERVGGKLHWQKKPAEDFDMVTEVDSVDVNENFTQNSTTNMPSEEIQNVLQAAVQIPTLRATQVTRTLLRAFHQIAVPQKQAGSNQIGCGKSFTWSALPKIEDELILELFKVKTIDQAKQLI